MSASRRRRDRNGRSRSAEHPTAKPPEHGDSQARAGAWARRAPLLPALIFMIIVTQLPFVATLVISFMNWNAYYPDERGFAGLANYRRVFTDANTRSRDRASPSCSPSSVVLISLVLGLVHRPAARPQVPRAAASCGR